MLKVKKLHPDAVTPTVANPGEDLGYDLYSVEQVLLEPGKVYKIKTGLAATAFKSTYLNGLLYREEKLGMLIRDRSSMASKGIFTHGGVLDGGYTGEIMVLMSTLEPFIITKGMKFAQMVPVEILTSNEINELNTGEELDKSARGSGAFGSSGA
jgi:dUTP pyrophosphatase